MSGNRFRSSNQWYFAGHEDSNVTNDAADAIISQPDRYLLSQEGLFNANGGWATIASAVGLSTIGTFAMLAGAPRMAAHFRNGQCVFYDWVALMATGSSCYMAGQYIDRRSFGDNQAYHNHWMAYTFVKSLNRYEGRRILTKAPSY